ncbi:hypothetical protein TR2A62_2323 [Thalassobium sp. R2A62]|nr:hypothetical protein TR2A62_2323 [Thalassobium sp. R2A62]
MVHLSVWVLPHSADLETGAQAGLALGYLAPYIAVKAVVTDGCDTPT